MLKILIIISHVRHQQPRVFRRQVRDLTVQASLRQEQEAGDVEEQGAEDDSDHD